MNPAAAEAVSVVSAEATTYAIDRLSKAPNSQAVGMILANLNVLVITRFLEECVARDVPGSKELIDELADK